MEPEGWFLPPPIDKYSRSAEGSIALDGILEIETLQKSSFVLCPQQDYLQKI